MGLMRNIVVVEYSPEWPAAFEREAASLRPALGAALREFHHIGSTSVPGLAAKPVIDMLAVVADLAALDARDPFLLELGYTPKGEFGIAGRRFYSKGADDARTHHLHAFAEGHASITRHFDFRDYLRAHPEAAAHYGALKQRLAAENREEIEVYLAGKAGFIEELLAKAQAWRAGA